MQTSSDALASAIEAPHRVIRSDVSVDWDNDGHGDSTSLDRISRQITNVKLNQTLSTNVPEQVQIIPGAAVAQLDVTIEQGNVFGCKSDVKYKGIYVNRTGVDEYTNTITFNKPLDAVVGDLLVVCISSCLSIDNSPVYITETNINWNIVSRMTDYSGASVTSIVLTHCVAADDPSSYTFSLYYTISHASAMLHYGNANIAGIHASSAHKHNNQYAYFTTIQGESVTSTLDACSILDIFVGMSANHYSKWRFDSNAIERVNHTSQTGSGSSSNIVQGICTYENVDAQTHSPKATIIPEASPLNTNPYFESDLSGWDTVASSVTFERSNTVAHEGSYGLKITSDGSTYSIAYTDPIAVTAGNAYSCFGWYRSDDDINATNVMVDWFDVGDSYLSTTYIDWTYESSDGWRLANEWLTAPASAVIARFGVEIYDKPAGTVAYADELYFLADSGYVIAWGVGTVTSLILAPSMQGDDRQNPAWTYSELNPNNQLAGKQRNNRPITWDIGFATQDGIETVPMFQGYTLGLDVSSKSRTASITALDNREKFRDNVVLPVLVADWPRAIPGETLPYKPGLESTWPVAYILGKFKDRTNEELFGVDGYYAAPPPRPGANLYVPCCGSFIPFVGTLKYAYAKHANDTYRPARFDFGPYLGATEKALYRGELAAKWTEYSSGLAFFMEDADYSAGRCEFWAKLDTDVVSTLEFNVIYDEDTGQDSVKIEIDTSGVFKGTIEIGGTTLIDTGMSVPTDGEWHAYGMHWNTRVSSGVGQITYVIDDTEVVHTFPPYGVTTTYAYADITYSATGFAQVAEIHFTGGMVYPTIGCGIDFTTPWVWENFTPTAFIDRSINQLLGGLYSPSDDEWKTLTDIAEAEFAAMYFDQNGLPHYRTSISDVTPDGQTIVRVLNTRNALAAIDYTSDISLIANQITVSSSSIEYVLSGTVWTPSTPIFIKKDTSISFTFTTTERMFSQDNLSVVLTEANTLFSGGGSVIPETDFYYYVVDLSETGYDGFLYIENNSASDAWLVNTSGTASLTVVSAYIKSGSSNIAPVVMEDANSQRKYRIQPLSISSSAWRQTEDFSASLALKLLSDMKEIHPILKNISIVGDPRLQLGDCVRLVDVNGLGLDDIYRIASISSEASKGGFSQKIAARRASLVALWDVNSWGDGTVWAA